MTDWRERAACLGQPVSRFFPEDPNRYPKVVRLCDGCVVKSACLDEALLVPANVDRYGVYGGLTPPQRRRLRVEREQSPPTPPDISHDPTPLEWDADAGIYREVTS
jgi:hypothetical protein